MGVPSNVGTIIDYVTSRTGSFDERAFTEVDALVLALLSYQRMPNNVVTLDETEHRYATFPSRLRTFLCELHEVIKQQTHTTPTTPQDYTANQSQSLLQLHPQLQQSQSQQSQLYSQPRLHTPQPQRSLRTLLRGLFHTPFSDTTLADICAMLTPNDFSHESGFTGLTDPKTTETLFTRMASNPRFASIRVGGVEERFSEKDQTQFAAITMMLPDGTLAIAFRGTDASFVGWKEDFAMAFQYPVPAQQSAADYVAHVARLWEGDLILLGHSKGGNLAVYAAMNVDDDVRERIRTVYSLDGPGFPDNVVNSAEYNAVVNKIVKIVPETSIVGMILETPEPCRVVRSNERGMMQHDAFSWQVCADAFVEVPDVSASSRYFNKSLNEWLAGMSVDQRERAVDALFSVLEASEQKGLLGLMDAGPKSIRAMIGTFAGLSDEDRKHLLEAATLLIRVSLSIGVPLRSEKDS